MNDAPVDIGIVNNLANPLRPLVGEALPIVGIVAFLDHTGARSSAARSATRCTDIDNSDGQAPNAFQARPVHASATCCYYPVPNVMIGGELQWGRRENFSDGFHSDGLKLQFSFKYNFSQRFGG